MSTSSLPEDLSKLSCLKPIQAQSRSLAICLTLPKATAAYDGSLPVKGSFFPFSCTPCVHNQLSPPLSTPPFSPPFLSPPLPSSSSLPLLLPCLSSTNATTSFTAASPHGGDQTSLSTNRTPHPRFLHPCICDVLGLWYVLGILGTNKGVNSTESMKKERRSTWME